MKPFKIITTLIVLVIVGYFFVLLSAGFSRSSIRIPERLENISNMKTINIALLAYYHKHRKYPDTLQQLVDEKELEKEQLKLNDLELHYIKGLTAVDGDKIILYTPAKYSGLALVAHVDGSALSIDGEELTQLLTQQQKESADQEQLLETTP